MKLRLCPTRSPDCSGLEPCEACAYINDSVVLPTALIAASDLARELGRKLIEETDENEERQKFATELVDIFGGVDSRECIDRFLRVYRAAQKEARSQIEKKLAEVTPRISTSKTRAAKKKEKEATHGNAKEQQDRRRDDRTGEPDRPERSG